jgi:hypothetical protein
MTSPDGDTYCPSCGRARPAQARFCPNCGAAFGPTDAGAVEPQSIKVAPSQGKGNPVLGRSRLPIAVAFVALAIAVVAGFSLLGSNSSGTSWTEFQAHVDQAHPTFLSAVADFPVTGLTAVYKIQAFSAGERTWLLTRSAEPCYARAFALYRQWIAAIDEWTATMTRLLETQDIGMSDEAYAKNASLIIARNEYDAEVASTASSCK